MPAGDPGMGGSEDFQGLTEVSPIHGEHLRLLHSMADAPVKFQLSFGQPPEQSMQRSRP